MMRPLFIFLLIFVNIQVFAAKPGNSARARRAQTFFQMAVKKPQNGGLGLSQPDAEILAKRWSILKTEKAKAAEAEFRLILTRGARDLKGDVFEAFKHQIVVNPDSEGIFRDIEKAQNLAKAIFLTEEGTGALIESALKLQGKFPEVLDGQRMVIPFVTNEFTKIGVKRTESEMVQISLEISLKTLKNKNYAEEFFTVLKRAQQPTKTGGLAYSPIQTWDFARDMQYTEHPHALYLQRFNSIQSTPEGCCPRWMSGLSCVISSFK